MAAELTQGKDFKIIKPIILTDTIVTQNDFTNEAAIAPWNIGTSYNAGDTVYYSAKLPNVDYNWPIIYEALQSTTGDNPAFTTGYWSPIQYLNKYRFRDLRTGTYSTNEEDTTYQDVTIVSEFANGETTSAIAFFGLTADTLSIKKESLLFNNIILNSDFDIGLSNWTDVSTGTGTVEWAHGGFAKITRVDASNIGRLLQNVLGTSGTNRILMTMLGASSTGRLRVSANGVISDLINPGDEHKYLFTSDGNDAINLFAADDVSYGNVAYCKCYDSLIANSFFTTDLTGWTDVSTGTGTAAWFTGGFARLITVDASNIGKIEQTVSGISGTERTLVVKNNATSSGSVRVTINGVVQSPTVAFDTEEEFIFTSDGSDTIVLESDIGTLYVDYAYLLEKELYYNQQDIDVSALTEYQELDFGSETDTKVTVTFSRTNKPLQLSQMIIGELYTIGQTQKGVTLGIDDYSTKESESSISDAVYLDKGIFTKEIKFPLVFLPEDVESVYNTLGALNGLPCVFLSELYSFLIIFGFYQNFKISMSSIALFNCDLNIEELT